MRQPLGRYSCQRSAFRGLCQTKPSPLSVMRASSGMPRGHQVVAVAQGVVVALIDNADPVGRFGDHGPDPGKSGQHVEAVGVVECGVADHDPPDARGG